MTADQCNSVFCYIKLQATAPKFFGFSEFLAALALMVLAWTIADVRYRFRVRTAPLPLQEITFGIVGAVGFLSLMTDWWRAEQWRVPEGHLITPAGWQALLGGLFLLTFLTWAWFAFIRPPVFSRWNAVRFGRQLIRVILRGSPTEIPEVADELAKSAKNLIRYSWTRDEREKRFAAVGSPKIRSRERVREHAHDLLGMVADRKFCKFIVQSSPVTAFALFEEMALQNRYGVPLGIFARNITAEAILNRDSFVYQEVAGYYTGFVGEHKPLTSALYANYELVDTLKSVFDIDHREQDRWDADQWEAFGRLVLMSFDNYAKKWAQSQHSFVISRAIHGLQNAVAGLTDLGDSSSGWEPHSSVEKLRVVVDFALNVVKILDSYQAPGKTAPTRYRDGNNMDMYDLIARLMFHIIVEASNVKESWFSSWSIQHNSVWSRFFSNSRTDGPAGKIVAFKLRRLIFEEIAHMAQFPNYKGSKLLGMTLNVMGLKFERGQRDSQKSAAALHKATLSWTKKYFARIHDRSPTVMEFGLMDGFKYEGHGPRIVQTGRQILDYPPHMTALNLDAGPQP